MAQKLEFKVGLFIAITTVLIMASVGYVFYKKGIFAPVHTYTLSSRTGESLTEGMPVVFGGIVIGRVNSTELDELGTVIIRIKIPERYNRVIRADSKFVIEKPLLGESRIVVTTVNLKGPLLSPAAISEVTVSSDINEIIRRARPIVDKADRIMESVAQITENLADPNGEVRRILKDAETVTSRFSKKESILEMAVGDPESIRAIHETLGRLRDISVRADSLFGKAETLVGSTGEEIYGPGGVLPLVRDILRDMLAKLAKLDIALENINKVTGEAADSTKDLKALRYELDAAVTAIGNLADEIDRKIPFKSKPEIKLP
jgi:phospholipid/cholesterol/gamma-HCH transport system substrate-binding protein